MSELFKLNDKLYLKPLSRIAITVKITNITTTSEVYNKAISNWEIIQKIKKLSPLILTTDINFKLERSSLEYLRFICDLTSRSDLKQAIVHVDKQNIKLPGFTKSLPLRAVEYKNEYPRPHDWTAFFRDAPNLDESIPGQRPDTIVIRDLPIRWFIDNEFNSEQPSEQRVREAFKCFGDIRNVDIPMLDPVQNIELLSKLGLNKSDISKETKYIRDYLGEAENIVSSSSDLLSSDDSRNNPQKGFGRIDPNSGSFSAGDGPLTFTTYVQYQHFLAFSKAIEALRGVKLLYSPEKTEPFDESNQFAASILVDFDRTQHLSDAKIKKRKECSLRLDKLSKKRKQQTLVEEAERLEKELEKKQLAEKIAEKEEMLRLAKKRAREEEKAADMLKAEKLRRREADKHCKREKDALQEQIDLITAHDEAYRNKLAQAERLIAFLNDKLRKRSEREFEREKPDDQLMRERILARREQDLRERLLQKMNHNKK
ncbi:A kinase (PRKA) anchor protein 17A [Cichlidogyrus casuarinus]|uniref:A kinase (PRKA) anchor protein 17A n=1 Tax=Cichlidogyrus casuarinus TaxID=1844966 RepID=A0ABD2QNK1_9PLAT